MSAPTDDDPTTYRLPYSVVPSRYRLTLVPDLAAGTFTGDVEIDVTVSEPVTDIVLNAAELTISSAELSPAGAGDADNGASVGTAPLDPSSTTLDADEERVTLTFAQPVPVGPATLRLSFTGILNDKLHGFYRSTFTDDDGDEQVIATTQMEATDARRAFPCWDEPDRKAVFEVTLVVNEGLAAYLQRARRRGGPEPASGGRPRPAGSGSPRPWPMSTYLVAFIVGPLEATEPVDVDGVPLRIVHPPGKAHLTPFALEVGAHALRFFTDYFGIPYPADKLDLVAIPDFAFGAMENLGCVTFRESVLLVDPGQAARVELERVADVICHEIAHMWFGDLVTMKWWNGIWLNEAFATFMEVLAVDAFRPEWQRWVSFGVEREAAMAVDGLHATRPVEFPVGRPEEAQGMFDVLTYQKGGSVLRMLEQYLGPEVFRDGIRRLPEHAQLRQHRDRRPVGRPGALERPARAPASWTPGSTRAATPGPRGRGRLPVPGALLVPGRAGRRHRVRLADPRHWSGRLRRNGGDPVPVLVGGDGTPASSLRAAPTRWSTPAARASTGSPTRPPWSSGWPPSCPSSRPSSATTWCRTPGLPPWPARRPLADLLRLAGALGRSGEGDPSVWSVVIGALGLLDRIVPDADRPVLATGRAHPGRPGRRAAGLGPEGRRRGANAVAARLGAPDPGHGRR